MGVYSNTVSGAYADKIKAVYEHLYEIKKVADRLTPVEDLESFQSQIEDIHANLDVMVEASNLLVTATEVGETVLTASSWQALKVLLGVDQLHPDSVTVAMLNTALAALQQTIQDQIDALSIPSLDGIHTSLSGLQGSINTITADMSAIQGSLSVQQGLVSGLQTSYTDLLNGISSNQTNITAAISRLTVVEGLQIIQDSNYTTLAQNYTNLQAGLTATNTLVSGQAASITVLEGQTQLNNSAITQLTSELLNTNTNLSGHSDALDTISTTLTGIGNDLIAQANQTTSLKSVIGGSGNLLPNAEFSMSADGWTKTVGQGDWATTPLATDSFIRPAGVHSLDLLGTPSPNGQIVIESPPVPVDGDGFYAISGYPCASNGVATLGWRAYNTSGGVVAQGVCPPAYNPVNNSDMGAYERVWSNFQIFPGTTHLKLYFSVAADGDGVSLGSLFRPMLEKSWYEQTGPSAWTPNLTGVADALATAVTGMSTQVSNLGGVVTALSTAHTTLAARVGDTESALVNEIITSANKDAAHSASINTLSSRLVTAENDILGTAGAVSSLTTRVTNAEGTITSQGSALTSLQAQVNALDLDTGGVGSAIAALDTRVDATEAAIISHGSAITALENSVTSANKVFAQNDPPPTSGRTHNDLWIDTNDGNKIYTFDTGTTSWVPRMDGNRSKIFVQPSAPSGANTNDLWFDSDDGYKPYRWTGSAWQEITDMRITANASAITSLTTRVSNVEGVNTSQATAITNLQSSVDNPTTGLAANASAINTLTTRVTNAEGVNTAQASSINSLSTTVGNHTATITSHATSINGVMGKAGVTVDVNGHITGWALNNNGASGEFVVVADAFKVLSPGASDGLEIQDGYVRVWKDSSQTIMGNNFGVPGENLVRWFGPNIGAAACTKANAVTWEDSSGHTYFGGSLSAGVLRTAMQTTDLSPVAQITIGPFGTAGKKKVVVCSVNTTINQVLAGNVVSAYNGQPISAQVNAYRKVGAGGETHVITVNASGTLSAEYEPGVGTLVFGSMSGSTTMTDTTGGTSDFQYRAQMVSRNSSGLNVFKQTVSISSTEEP